MNEFISRIGSLKELDRTGWVRRGIKNPESVAEHSFGVTVLALVLADKVSVDKNKAVKMALIHDLAEWKVGDLTPVDSISAEEKYRLEVDAFKELFVNIDGGDELLELFLEYEDGETPEAKFVKRLDKLEMMFQANKYGLGQPEVNLQEFWDQIKGFDFGELEEIYGALEASHFNK